MNKPRPPHTWPKPAQAPARAPAPALRVAPRPTANAAVQLKPARAHTTPPAPAPYRPQPAPKCLQPKAAPGRQSTPQARPVVSPPQPRTAPPPPRPPARPAVQLKQSAPRAAAPFRSTTIQGCFICGDLTCLKGEKCKRTPDMEGLFTPGTKSPYVGPHKETKKHSKRKRVESEHTVPSASLKKSKTKHTYNNEPTISIPYGMHRGGQSGAGGGISSTGSSKTASGWSTHLGSLISSGNWYETIRQACIDGINAAAVSDNLNEGMVSGYIQIVNGHLMMGRIDEEEAGRIKNEIYNLYLSWQRLGMTS